jgi:hypothetical protein
MGHPDNVLLLPLSLSEEASCLVVSNLEFSGGSGVYDSLFHNHILWSSMNLLRTRYDKVMQPFNGRGRVTDPLCPRTG